MAQTDTTDLEARLRFELRDWDGKTRTHFPAVNALLIAEAADALDAKDRTIAGLREALEPFAKGSIDVSGSAVILGYPAAKEALTAAREALKGSQP